MIPEVLVWRIQEMRQPRLLQPICPNMLDGNGLPSAPLLAGVDALFAEDALQHIASWEMPAALLGGAKRNDRWRLVSSLQKAIRQGDVRAAMDAAHALYAVDPGYLLKRLVVCAVEDVMLGNLYAVAATLALAGDRASRRLAGELKVLVWLAAQLAKGWKDRTACNLCVVVDFDRELHPVMHEWKRLPDSELAAKASDLQRSIEERMLAAWLLAGTKRFWNVNVPADNDRPRASLMRTMVQTGMPLLLYWIADRAATRGGDCMFVSLFPIWQMMVEGFEPELRSNQPRAAPLLGGVLAAAYDMHTREGQSALRKLAQCRRLEELLAVIASPQDRLAALYAALFIVEGGKLNLRISTSETDRLHFQAIAKELAYFGISGPAEQRALLGAVETRLDLLDHYRREIVTVPLGERDREPRGIRTQPYTTPPGQGLLSLYQAPSGSNPINLRVLPDVFL